MTEALKDLRKDLITDLTSISRIIGNYEFSDEARENWIQWYEKYDETSPNRLCTDPAFNGWYSRKPMFLQKLAMILQSCETSERLLEWKYFERAIKELHEVEKAMSPTFNAVGKSEIATEVNLVMDVIKRHRFISEKQIMQITWRDIDKSKMDNVLGTAVATGQYKRYYQHPETKEKGIFYEYLPT